MNRVDLKILEKAFTCQIEGRMFQSKSKRVKELAELGYLHFVRYEDQTGFGILICEGYELTHLGNLEYCTSCKDVPDE